MGSAVLEAPAVARPRAGRKSAKPARPAKQLPLFGADKARLIGAMAAWYLFTATDLFCGAGGTTTGFEKATMGGRKIVRTTQVVNHDPQAIASHAANHAAAKHFTEDITKLDANLLVRTSLLWASLECTNFSNAKGGQSRDADSRSLAEHMERYIRAVMPLYFCVENVREFMSWGPLYHKKGKDGKPLYRTVKVMEEVISTKTGKPVILKSGKVKTRQVVNERGELVTEQVPVMVPESRTKGRDFIRWRQSIEDLGYTCHYKLLNAADYGERTSRVRLFMVFAKTGLPVRWPKATHSRNAKTENTLPWLPVRPCLSLEVKGRSIFNRTKTNKKGDVRPDPLVEKTLKRIYAGLCKYVAGRKVEEVTAWLAGLAATSVGGRLVPPGAVEPAWLMKRSSNPPSGKPNAGASLDEPGPTVATGFHPDLVQVKPADEFITKAFTGEPEHLVQGTDVPAGAVTTVDHHQLAQLEFITMRHDGSEQSRGRSLDQPGATVTTKDHHTLIQVEQAGDAFLMQSNGGPDASKVTSTEEPGRTVLASPNQSLAQVEFLTNPAWGGNGFGNTSAEEPAHTIVARQDKVPLSVVQAEFTAQGGAWLDKRGSNPPSGKPNPGVGLGDVAPTITTCYQPALVQPEFITQYNGGSDECRNLSLEGPANTITTENRFGLVQPVQDDTFIQKYYGNGDNVTGMADPAGALTTRDRMGVVQTEPWLDKRYGSGDHNHQSIEQPAGAITTNDHHAVVQPEFLHQYFGNGENLKSLDDTAGTLLTKEKLSLVQTESAEFIVPQFSTSEPTSSGEPVGTVTTNPRARLVQTEWLDRRFGSGDHNHLPVTSAAGTITTIDNHGLAQVVPANPEPWLVNTNFENEGTSLDQPGPTLTAGRHHPYVAHPEPWLLDNKFGNVGRDLEQPGPTLLTGDHHYLISPEVAAAMPHHWFEQADDSETMRLIRRFMRAYGLSDILLRMLLVQELLKIQGFPGDYVLLGSTTDQKKFIGNSVPPKMSQRISEALFGALEDEGLLHLLADYDGGLGVDEDGLLTQMEGGVPA